MTPHIYYGHEGSVDIADEIEKAKQPLVPKKEKVKKDEPAKEPVVEASTDTVAAVDAIPTETPEGKTEQVEK